MLPKERNIRFQTPFPARPRVFYNEATVIYNLAEEAMADMAEMGIPVTVLTEKSSPCSDIPSEFAVKPGKLKPQERLQGVAPGFQNHNTKNLVMEI